MKKKKEHGTLWYIFQVLKWPFQLVFYIIYYPITWIVSLSTKQIEKAKKKQNPTDYAPLTVITTETGSYAKFERLLFTTDSLIGIILGARGTGKTALGMKLLENMHARTKRSCYAMGFNKDDVPAWITVVEKPDAIENDSIVLIDEGGILFGSRNAQSKPNKLLSNLLLIARHKNMSILFISQNSSNLDVNILRQADCLIMKPSSLLQEKFERKIISEIYNEKQADFARYKSDKGITYIYSDAFRGFVSNPLPKFWKQTISKSFR